MFVHLCRYKIISRSICFYRLKNKHTYGKLTLSISCWRLSQLIIYGLKTSTKKTM